LAKKNSAKAKHSGLKKGALAAHHSKKHSKKAKLAK
jgi:hypothetical protein